MACFEKVRGDGVTEGVTVRMLGDAGLADGLPHRALRECLVHVVPTLLCRPHSAGAIQSGSIVTRSLPLCRRAP
jgi:hypothetical protein